MLVYFCKTERGKVFVGKHARDREREGERGREREREREGERECVAPLCCVV